MKLNPILTVLALLFVIAIFPTSAFALRSAKSTLVQVPFDGGLSLLVAAGVGYAAKRKYNSRKKEQEPSDTL